MGGHRASDMRVLNGIILGVSNCIASRKSKDGALEVLQGPTTDGSLGGRARVGTPIGPAVGAEDVGALVGTPVGPNIVAADGGTPAESFLGGGAAAIPCDGVDGYTFT
jgi:hypothetical protein